MRAFVNLHFTTIPSTWNKICKHVEKYSITWINMWFETLTLRIKMVYKREEIGPWDLCWLKQWYIDQVSKKKFPTCGELTQSNTLCHHVPINQKTPLLQGRQFYQDHCQPIAPSTDNSKSYSTSSQKHKNTRFPILGRFFYCFFTIFNILIIINNLLQNLVWSCRFQCTQN